MLIHFNKYQGAGNDFIIIDNLKNQIRLPDRKTIANMCNRHFGIGSDGLILIDNHPDYAFEMKYFNADGNPGTMCGNGGRCAFAFSLHNSIVEGSSSFMASDGVHTASITEKGEVRLSMSDVLPPELISGNHFLDTGSPHYIIPVSNVSKVDVGKRGSAIRSASQFSPGGTNVNFIQVESNCIRVRTFERGVEAETLSCGTGLTASAISSKWGVATGQQIVKVETPGGSLEVEFFLDQKGASSVFLTGPAKIVFEGDIETDNFK